MSPEKLKLSRQVKELHQQLHETIWFGQAITGTYLDVGISTNLAAFFTGISTTDLKKLSERELSLIITSGEDPVMRIEIVGSVYERINLRTAMTSTKERQQILYKWYNEIYSATQNSNDFEFHAHTHKVLEQARILLGFAEFNGRRVLGMFDLQYKTHHGVRNHLLLVKEILDSYLSSEQLDKFNHQGAISREEAHQLLKIIWDLLEINQPGTQRKLADKSPQIARQAMTDGDVCNF